jgi:hypothetical protein
VIRSLIVVALAGVALASLPCDGSAQTVTKPVQFGIAAGAATPTSNLSNVANTGYNGTVALGFNSASFPLGLRIDAAHNHFGLKSGGDVHVSSLTGNAVYKIPRATLSPYAIAGAGWYLAEVGPGLGFGFGSHNHFGWNVGGGISMPLRGFDAFIEARYNQVQVAGSLRFVPITFGVMF